MTRPETFYIVSTVMVGLGATLLMDAWALLLKRAFNSPSANYCLVGRWLRHMPRGTFRHANIATASPMSMECTVGWVAHYIVGVAYAVVFVAAMPGNWLLRPTLLPALLFGMASVLVPYLIMQPSFGLGIAAWKAPRPMQARLRSFMAHTVFGVGLYACAVGVRYVARIQA